MQNKKSVREYAWGVQRVHVRKDSLAVKILKGVAITGAVALAASNPYFGLRLWKALDRRRFRKSLTYLRSRGYVRILSEDPDGMKIEITQAGKRVIKHVDIAELTLQKPATWDQKWRVIVFDIPNWKSKNRDAFREKIKMLGFRLVQKSVWVYPHECREQIMILRKFYDIEKYVTYLEATHTEDEDAWLLIFHTLNKKS